MSPGILSEFVHINFVNYLKLFERTFLTKMIQSRNTITGVNDLRGRAWDFLPTIETNPKLN